MGENRFQAAIRMGRCVCVKSHLTDWCHEIATVRVTKTDSSDFWLACDECFETWVKRMKEIAGGVPSNIRSERIKPGLGVPDEPVDEPLPEPMPEPEPEPTDEPAPEPAPEPEPEPEPEPTGEPTAEPSGEQVVVVFDIETTGLEIGVDKIWQFAATKVFIGGDAPGISFDAKDTLHFVCNPGRPMSPDATAVHGKTDADVRGKPFFKEFAKQVVEFIGDHPLVGFNVRNFDVPFLWHELHNLGIHLPMDGRPIIDAYEIFRAKEPRDLKAAYKFYCSAELEGAHDALNDIAATAEVLLGQIERYDDLKGLDAQGLDMVTNDRRVDLAGKLYWDDKDQICWNFGKHEGLPVEKTDPGYIRWFLAGEFPAQSQQIVKLIFERK